VLYFLKRKGVLSMVRSMIKNICLIGFAIVATIAAAAFVTWLWFRDFSLGDIALMGILSGLVYGTWFGFSLGDKDDEAIKVCKKEVSLGVTG